MKMTQGRSTLRKCVLLVTVLFWIMSVTFSEQTCDVIDSSCVCFQPPGLRCHFNSSDDATTALKKFGSYPQILSKIRIFDLAFQNLKEIPKGLFKNFNFSALVVTSESRMLYSISRGAFDNLDETLIALKLPGNGFQIIPEEISVLKKLQSLDLSDNLIRTIDSEVFASMISIQEINLSQNRIEKISSISWPDTLKVLNVGNNQITLTGLDNLASTSLKSLDVSHNRLSGTFSSTSILGQDVIVQSELKYLDLSFNRLSKLEAEAFKKFPSLSKLNLKSNVLEILDQGSFESLSQLVWLDLSHNRILELVGGTLKPLSALNYLDLSFNSIQVLDGQLTEGLSTLSYLNLRANNIFKIETTFIDNCHICKTIILTDNSLDCTCEMRGFQNWLQTNHRLDRATKLEAKCSTPPEMENAILNDLSPISCSDSADVVDPVTLQQYFTDGKIVNITWMVRLNNFDCESLQIFSNGLSRQEVYSRRQSCRRRHQKPHGVDIIETALEVSKLSTVNAKLLACLILKGIDEKIVSGCGQIILGDFPNKTEDFNAITDLSSKYNSSAKILTANFNFQGSANFSTGCKVMLAVRDTRSTQETIAQARTSCKKNQFVFYNLHLSSDNFYDLCAKLEVPTSTLQCSKIETDGSANKKDFLTPRFKPVLPLVVTLISLVVVIGVLFVIYLIFRGHFCDNKKAGLKKFVPCFAKRRRSRRRNIQFDEFSLQDNLTITSLIPE